MPEFQMRTEGVVDNGPMVAGGEYKARSWQDLDAFTQGYIEAMFFTEEEPGTTREQRVTKSGKVRAEWKHREEEGQQKDMPGDYEFGDIAPEALARIESECKRFQELNAELLQRAYERDDYSDEQAGRDFWFTRNGHGVGYWDRDQLDADGLGDALTKRCGWRSMTERAANPTEPHFGEVDIYIGDDGKVYQS